MATIKDVAQEAGLAVSTVSRILNNRGYISQDAKKKVEDAMKKLNYQPNELARSLHRKNSNLIGLIVPHVKHPYFAEVISKVEDQAYQNGYRLLLCNSQTIHEREQDYIEICKQNRVAGIIICSGGMSLSGLVNLGVPIVAWERSIEDGISVVECDNVQGGMLAATHLIDKGCRCLLHFGTVLPVNMPGDLRYSGFKKVCDQRNVACYEEYMNDGKGGFNYRANYREQIIEILKKHPEADGVFANNDILAAQTLQACSCLGIKVPEEMKIVGYDDVFLTNVTTPTLTTIKQPVGDMARHAVYLLDHSIKVKKLYNRTMFPVTLVERESTK